MATNFKPIQLQPFILAGAGALIGDTTLVFSSMADIDGNLLAMSDFGTIGFITLEPAAGVQEEAIQFTGLTQNVNGTATLSGVSNTGFKYPYTVTSGLLKAHTGGVKAVVSNTAAYYNKFLILDDPETITQVLTFATGATPLITDQPTTSLQAANKQYVDSVAIAGAPNGSTTGKGIYQEATSAQIDAGTASGSTGADLVINPSLYQASNTYKNTTTTQSGVALNFSSNKVEDNADTSATSAANKLVRTNGSGFIDTSFFQIPINLTTLLAAESITIGQPVDITDYQSDGGVTFDAENTATGTLTSAGGTVTISLAVGSHTNRALVVYVGVVNAAATTESSASYNGTAMTQIDRQSGNTTASHFTSYLLFAPSTGTNNLTVVFPSSSQNYAYAITVASYYNAAQTIDSHLATAYQIGGSATVSPTPVADGVVYVSAIGSVTGSLPTTFSNLASNQQTANNALNNIAIVQGDSGIVIPKVSPAISGTSNSSWAFTIGLAPITAPVYGYVRKAGSATVANPAMQNRYTGFVGFATNSATVTQNVVVQYAGVITGLSGLVVGNNYYLNDTNGTIGSTAGTNTRKIGIALTSTTLLITNIW